MASGGVVGPVRVLVVEDDELVSRSFCGTLGRAKHLATPAYSIGQACECIERAQAAAEPFEVALLDLGLPDGDGESLVPLLRALRPAPGLAVVSAMADDWRAVRLARARIPLLSKPVGAGALVELVQLLSSGPMRADPIGDYCRHHGLSPQETALVRATAEGLRTDEAAARLGCSAHTVRGYWQRIFDKTGVRSKPALFCAIAQAWTDEQFS